jgi:hypothetical protein
MPSAAALRLETPRRPRSRPSRAVRHPHDFYETQRWQLEALLCRVPLPPGTCVVEPCAGNGALAVPLVEHGYRVWANDLVERPAYALDSELDATQRASWEAIRRETPIQAVVANLPFALALPILRLAVEFAPFVATILRRTWDEPTHDRGPWLAAHPCTGQIVLPRHSYRGKGSDSTTTAWFLWDRGGWLRQPFDLVTKQERDALVARYGRD